MSALPFARLESLEPRRLMTCYTLTDLGTLGGRESYAFDVNENNEVVGYAQNAAGADRAFLFADANNNGVADPGEMRDLGVLAGDAASYAYGLNNAGQVVGTSRSVPLGQDAGERAVRFNPGAAPPTWRSAMASTSPAATRSRSTKGGRSSAAPSPGPTTRRSCSLRRAR